MLSKRPDELGWQNGLGHPVLYTQCQLTWAGLGDLVHDSADPNIDVTTPVDNFLIYGGYDDRVDKSLKATMASWVHIDHVSDVGERREVRERRFAVNLLDLTKDANGFSHITEMLIGRGRVITTIFASNGSCPSYYRFNGCDETVVQSFINLLQIAPESQPAVARAREKKHHRTKLYAMANELHTMDASDGIVGILGSVSIGGQSVDTLSERLRSAADSTNNMRLPLYFGQIGRRRLFDNFERRFVANSAKEALDDKAD